MCSQAEGNMFIKNGPRVNFKYKNGMVLCKKCDNNAFVLLQGKDPLCRSCHYDYCSHKFRSTIGKSKLVKHGDKVLVAYSGGVSSSALVHMIRDGLNTDLHRKLIFVPSLLYIDDGIVQNTPPEDREIYNKEIIQTMSDYGWDIYVVYLEMSFRKNHDSFYYKIINSQNTTYVPIRDNIEEFNHLFSKIKSVTEKEEFVRCLKYRLIGDIGHKEGFDKIFVGNNASNLSVQLITHTALGKGLQLFNETGFFDNRHNIPILRPMREFVIKELVFYNIMHKVKFFTTPTVTSKLPIKSSIRKLSESFIFGLEKNFPATVYTILRTGNKLKSNESDNEVKKCIFCKSTIDTINKPSCSAYEALILTNNLSKNLPEKLDKIASSEMCYGCFAIANALESCDNNFSNYYLKKSTKQDIQDYLIDKDDDE